MLSRSGATMWPSKAACLACMGPMLDVDSVQLGAGLLLCHQLRELTRLCSTILVCLSLTQAAVPHDLCL